jgi:hypothetical protein
MIRLASLIETFEADLRAQYGDKLTGEHFQALAAMKRCRTQASLCRIPAVIVTVPIVSIMKVNNGWSARCASSCRLIIF